MSGPMRQLLIRSNDEIWQVGSAGAQRHDIVSPSVSLFFSFLEKSLIMASGGAFKQQCRPLTRLQSVGV